MHDESALLAQYLTEPQLCAYFGWAIGSEMPRIYVHLCARDISPRITDINVLLKNEANNRLDIGNCAPIRGVAVAAQRIDRDDTGRQATLFESCRTNIK